MPFPAVEQDETDDAAAMRSPMVMGGIRRLEMLAPGGINGPSEDGGGSVPRGVLLLFPTLFLRSTLGWFWGKEWIWPDWRSRYEDGPSKNRPSKCDSRSDP